MYREGLETLTKDIEEVNLGVVFSSDVFPRHVDGVRVGDAAVASAWIFRKGVVVERLLRMQGDGIVRDVMLRDLEPCVDTGVTT